MKVGITGSMEAKVQFSKKVATKIKTPVHICAAISFFYTSSFESRSNSIIVLEVWTAFFSISDFSAVDTRLLQYTYYTFLVLSPKAPLISVQLGSSNSGSSSRAVLFWPLSS